MALVLGHTARGPDRTARVLDRMARVLDRRALVLDRMARVFDRNISLAVTRQILDTWIKPNHMTIFSSWIGITGAAQFFYSTRHHELAGAFLIWLHTVLDGCDGEMARLTFRESRWGAWLDFWGDNLVFSSNPSFSRVSLFCISFITYHQNLFHRRIYNTLFHELI